MKGQAFIQPGKLNLNLAKIKKGGEKFEIVIDPDKAVEYKEKKQVEISEILKSQAIFADSNKGLRSSEIRMKELFGTDDCLKVAKIILDEGEIDLTKEYREKVQDRKRKKIISIIHANAIDPRSKLPHPQVRIESAINDAKINVDYFRTAEEQVDEIVKKIRTILPIKIALLRAELIIPPQSAHKAYSILKKYCKLKKENWDSQGHLVAEIEMPAGLQEEFLDKINNATHGSAELKILENND